MEVKLMQGDCLDRLREIPDGSVDMVLCDPPYGVTVCNWDKQIPMEPLWKELRRVIKPNGVVCVFGSEPFATKMRMAAIDLYKYDWVWKKNIATGFLQVKNMPLRDYELISVFSGGKINHKSITGPQKRMPYNPQGVKLVNRVQKVGKGKYKNFTRENPSLRRDAYMQEYEGYPHMVIDFKKEGGLHPTQKPVDLLEYLIRTYTNEGETVLDNTMGSGSTGVAAVQTGRSFIGIELDEKYFKIASDRIAEAQKAVETQKTVETQKAVS